MPVIAIMELGGERVYVRRSKCHENGWGHCRLRGYAHHFDTEEEARAAMAQFPQDRFTGHRVEAA
jgi:hypothetical protein